MEVFASLFSKIIDAGLGFILIGGHAVSAHGYVRTTGDVDLLIRRSQHESWAKLLQALGYENLRRHQVFSQWRGALGTWPIDLMLVDDETFQKMSNQALEAVIAKITIKIPCLEHLLALKLHALKSEMEHRFLKDVTDVLYLLRINKQDPKSEEFRQLCLKHATISVYEKIIGQIKKEQ